MYCPRCGTLNPDDARFCGNCSQALPVATASPPEPTASSTPPSPTQPTASPLPLTATPPTATPTPAVGWTPPYQGTEGPVSSGLNIAIIVSSLIVPFIAIVMGVIYMRDANPAKKSAGRNWLLAGLGILVIEYILFYG